jgi:hypothetical protein
MYCVAIRQRWSSCGTRRHAELGDRFSTPNGGVVSGPVLQALAAESILQDRTLSRTSDIVTLAGLCIIALQKG